MVLHTYVLQSLTAVYHLYGTILLRKTSRHKRLGTAIKAFTKSVSSHTRLRDMTEPTKIMTI